MSEHIFCGSICACLGVIFRPQQEYQMCPFLLIIAIRCALRTIWRFWFKFRRV